VGLLQDLGYNTGANCAAAFTYREAQTFFHGDGCNQFTHDPGVVAGHDHFGAFRQADYSRYVSGPEVKLGTVPFKERSVTAALVLGQNVYLGLKLGVGSNGTWLSQYLSLIHI